MKIISACGGGGGGLIIVYCDDAGAKGPEMRVKSRHCLECELHELI